MPRDTERASTWTVDTVLAHLLALLAEKDLRDRQRYDAQTRALDAALLAQQIAVQAALVSAEKAVTKAEVAAEKRFDSVNEFRAAYQDVITQQMPRAEAEQRLAALAEKVGDLKLAAGQTQGHAAGLQSGWLILTALVPMVVGVILLVVALTR